MGFSLKYDQSSQDKQLAVDGDRKVLQQSMKELIEQANMHQCITCGGEHTANQIDFPDNNSTDVKVFDVFVNVIHICMDCNKALRVLVKINRNDVVKTIMKVKDTKLRSEIESFFFSFVGIALAEARTKLEDHVKHDKQQIGVVEQDINK